MMDTRFLSDSLSVPVFWYFWFFKHPSVHWWRNNCKNCISTSYVSIWNLLVSVDTPNMPNMGKPRNLYKSSICRWLCIPETLAKINLAVLSTIETDFFVIDLLGYSTIKKNHRVRHVCLTRPKLELMKVLKWLKVGSPLKDLLSCSHTLGLASFL